MRFKGGGLYELKGVERSHWSDFMSADSHGKHWHANLKDKFATKKLNG